jgi:uncharacterized membrane protein
LHIEESPDPDGFALAAAISDCGSIAGNTSVNSTTTHAWLLKKNKQTWINPPVPDHDTVAYGVNCSDEVVGRWRGEFYQGERPFFWSTETGILAIVVCPPYACYWAPSQGIAYSINEAGQVVGSWFGGDPPIGRSAFVWDLVNGATDLGPIFGCTPIEIWCSEALDINNLGQVLGVYRVGSSNEVRSFLWSPFDGKVDIPVDGAVAISDNGMVVGGRWEEAGVTIWVWTAVDGVSDVDTIPGVVMGLRINELGDIAGTRILSDGTRVATLWRHP